MEKDRCIEAATLLLTAVKKEKQARADQHRAILTLAQHYTASMGTTIDADLIDQLIEDIAPRGAYGTLPVSEFAGMELGPLMGCSAHQGDTIIFETINLYYRHRPLWDAVQALTLDAHRARRAAGKFGTLPPDLADKAGQLWVKKQHKLGWQGAIDLCDKIIIQLDPETAAAKEAARLHAREVKIWEFHEGTINLTAKLDVLDAKYVNATVGQIAGILHAKPEYAKVAIDILRAKALGIMAHPAVALSMIQGALQQPIFGTTAYELSAGMADAEPSPTHQLSPEAGEADHSNGSGRDKPTVTTATSHGELHAKTAGTSVVTGEVINTDTGRIDPDPHHCLGHVCGTITVPVTKLQPRVQIYIHLNTANDDDHGIDGSAEIERAGTVAVKALVELLDGKQVKLTPVIDLNTLPAEHQCRPSRRLKEAVLLTFPTEAFPFSNRSSRGLDLDHTVAYQPSNRDPQTRLGNFGPAGRRPHRAKTAGFWKCRQPVIGQLTWTSPLGFRYTVDRHGTHRQE